MNMKRPAMLCIALACALPVAARGETPASGNHAAAAPHAPVAFSGAPTLPHMESIMDTKPAPDVKMVIGDRPYPLNGHNRFRGEVVLVSEETAVSMESASPPYGTRAPADAVVPPALADVREAAPVDAVRDVQPAPVYVPTDGTVIDHTPPAEASQATQDVLVDTGGTPVVGFDLPAAEATQVEATGAVDGAAPAEATPRRRRGETPES